MYFLGTQFTQTQNQPCYPAPNLIQHFSLTCPAGHASHKIFGPPSFIITLYPGRHSQDKPMEERRDFEANLINCDFHHCQCIGSLMNHLTLKYFSKSCFVGCRIAPPFYNTNYNFNLACPKKCCNHRLIVIYVPTTSSGNGRECTWDSTGLYGNIANF